eukprot:9114713-Alexandrium_andersonii.AAC.1
MLALIWQLKLAGPTAVEAFLIAVEARFNTWVAEGVKVALLSLIWQLIFAGPTAAESTERLASFGPLG